MIKTIDQNARFIIGFMKNPCTNIPVLSTLQTFLHLFTTKILVLCTIFQPQSGEIFVAWMKELVFIGAEHRNIFY